MSTSHLTEDEMLARRLQFEEQVRGSGDAFTDTSSSRPRSSQEKEDMRLARQVARMDLEGSSSSRKNTSVPLIATTRGTDARHASYPEARPGSSYEARGAGSRSSGGTGGQESSSVYLPEQAPLRSRVDRRTACSVDDGLYSKQPSLPRTAGSNSTSNISSQIASHQRTNSLDDHLAYARRLQEQAFSNFAQNADTKAETSTDARTHEERDLAMAIRLHEMEGRGMGDRTATGKASVGSSGHSSSRTSSSSRLDQEAEDERLARYMAKGGESVQGLSDAQLASILGGRGGTSTSNGNHSRPSASTTTQRNRGQLPPSAVQPTPPPQYMAMSNPTTPVGRSEGPLKQPPKSAPVSPATISPAPGRGFIPNRGGTTATHVRTASLPSDPPGVALPANGVLEIPPPTKEKKKKKRNFLGFASRSRSDEGDRKPAPVSTAVPGVAGIPPMGIPPMGVPLPPGRSLSIPASIPPPPGGSLSAPASFPGPLPHSLSMKRDASQNMSQTGNPGALSSGQRSSCSACHQSGGTLLAALGKTYHPECFKCVTCNGVLDHKNPFAFSTDFKGEQHAHHRKCFAEMCGVQCTVCKDTIPANADGTVLYVKHPFFETEQMCPRHAENPGRRCTGCHRFEPQDEPFADLDDAGRRLCYACCRSVVIDSGDVKPLWSNVLAFFAERLGLPVWTAMREVPILVVGYDSLNDQMKRNGNVHGNSSQIMTRGLCLTEHANCNPFKLPALRFNQSSQSFEARDVNERGYEYYDVTGASKANPNSSVLAILCLSGLPRDLTASVLAHEATHAWLKLHPEYDARRPLPAQVEEGCAQLMAMLFLNEGLGPPGPSSHDNGDGPSDEKLRQYFRFSIETDENEIYGTGYRRAAIAYRDIGIEALLNHVVQYRNFPTT